MPHRLLARLTAEPWALAPGHLEQLAVLAAAPRAEAPAAPAPAPYRAEVKDGVAIIPVTGLLTTSDLIKEVLGFFGMEVTDPREVAAAVENAAGDARVKAIMLKVDSPGGELTGVKAAADAIFAARSAKPVAAHVVGLGCSAAYWLAAQAEHLSADLTATVGSIGVFQVIRDSSRAAENEGIKVHVVGSGPYKGTGVAGAPVTDEQLAAVRERVADLAAIFEADVARGRGLSAEQVHGWAGGQAWLAERARGLGLIDEVFGFGQALAECGTRKKRGALGVEPAAAAELSSAGTPARSAEPSSASEEGGQMADPVKPSGAVPPPAAPPTDPVAEFAAKHPEALAAHREEGIKAERARFAALAAAFPGEDKFVAEAFAAGQEVPQAQAAFKDVQLKRLADENAALKAAAAKPPAAPPAPPVAVVQGVDPVGAAPEPGAATDPEAKLEAEHKAELAAGTFHAGLGAYKALKAAEAKGLIRKGKE